MHGQTTRIHIARATVVLILLFTVQSNYAEHFEFDWPAPSRVTITEKTSMNDVSLEIQTNAEFAKRPQENGYAFVTQDTEIVEIKGVPEEHRIHVILGNSFWPTYLVTDTGQLLGISGLETLTQNLLVLSNEIDPTADTKKTVESEEFQLMLRDRVTIVWEGLIDTVAGMQLEAGETRTRSKEFSAYGVIFPVQISTSHLGPAEEVAGAVRLKTIITFNEDALKTFTTKIVSQLVGSEAANSLTLNKLQRKVSFDSVVSPATLLLHSARILDAIYLETDKGEELEISQLQLLSFDWTN